MVSWSKTNLCLSIFLFLKVFKSAFGLFEQCNHVVDLKAGQKIYINSPYYPAEYPMGTSCRYTVQAPLDYELSFKCTVKLNLSPKERDCQSEVFYFNAEGSEVLTESDYFCASTKFERKSYLNRAVISYISPPLYEKNLLGNTDETGDDIYDDELAYDDEVVEDTNTTQATSPQDLILPVTDFANAFTYLTELLTQNFSTTLMDTNTEGEIPWVSWRKRSSTNGTGNATDTIYTSKTQVRTSRIVNQNDTLNDGSFYGYFGNRGGGRFSCLVEVVEPPCDCGWSMDLKIAGATGVAGINEFPSMAGVKTIRFNQIFCGASIIHHHYLLSAAHCFMTPETNRSDLITVVVGENDISTVFDSLYTRVYEIEDIIIHEHYYTTARSLRNDIALLRTKFPIEWNRSVGPACLPLAALNVSGSDRPRKPPLPGHRLDTAGWGTTSFGGSQSSQLLKTTLDVLATDKCRRLLRIVPAGTFCTYTPGRDACQYDSGGALYLRSDRLFAVGIVSYGFACAARKPSINTRVASYIKWIKAKTPEANYCVK